MQYGVFIALQFQKDHVITFYFEDARGSYQHPFCNRQLFTAP